MLCEKPLARNAEEAKTMLDAVQKAGVKHMVAFNYRFVPAIRQARQLIESGALGRIYHYRAVYLQEWIMPHYKTPKIWRLDKRSAGSGALGDLGAHIIDLAHFLVGDIKLGRGNDKDLHPRAAARRGRRLRSRSMSTTPSSPRSSSRTARWARSRPRASPPDARTTRSSRSTPRRAAFASTWSA